MERLRESHTRGQFPNKRQSTTNQSDTTPEPLVMDSEITGLANLRGYLKFGNFVVRLSFDYVDIADRHPRFLERKLTPPAQQAAAAQAGANAAPSLPEPSSLPARSAEPVANNGTAKPHPQGPDKDHSPEKPERERKPGQTPYFD